MEVRLARVSLTAPSSSSPSSSSVAELPTIGHTLNSAVRGLLSNCSSPADTATKPTRSVLLNDVSAVFAPGTMTLVLGQPGSGKSSLLKLISGRLETNTALHVDGAVSYNGLDQSALSGRLPQRVSYVPQRDRHFPTLTVQETIAFAQACAAPSVSHGGVGAAMNRLGLGHCQDTLVGDAMVRGVSGGERKRVTLAEMDADSSRLVACLDEISTGLDSAATIDIVTQYRRIATSQRKTVVMALLQPAPEVVALFDSVMLLNAGHVLYHGPWGDAVEYFDQLGLRCPPHRDVADFLLDISTHQQTPYEQHSRVGHVPRLPSEFADIFQKSDLHHAIESHVHAPVDPVLSNSAAQWVQSVPFFHRSFWHNVGVLVKRDLLVTVRNRVGLQARLATLVIASLLHATLFYQLDEANVQLTMGILFASIQFLSLEQSSLVPAFQAARVVLYKQRAASLYRSSAYVVATSIGQMPMMIVQTLIFGSVVYWLCGFVASVSRFLVFELLLLLANLAFNAFFFFLAMATPNLHAAEPFNLMSLLLFMLFAGFMISRDLIPDYFIWAYWMSPMSWCLRSVVVNQYTAPEFDRCEYKGIDYCAKYGTKSMGEYALSVFNVQADPAWRWLGIAFMAGVYVLFMGLAAIVLEHVHYDEDESNHDQVVSSFADQSTATKEQESYHLVKSPCHDDVPTSAVIPIQSPTGLHERHFTPVTLAFTGLSYSVPSPADPKQPLTLLRDISGFAMPGSITALMGSSGAGKTTLMDVLAGRKSKASGTISGKIYLNGHEASDVAIRRCTAYCEQMDVHADASTFREALTFSAFLRQNASVPAAHKHESVDECLDLLDMRSIADRIVRGASVEQLKRLTIGVELAAQPSLLFLDEPTSGLDARAAKMIMDGVRKVADSGRTIVCTIHQPSFEVFQVFDRLLLLQRGGQTVYFGDLGTRGRGVVEYFEALEVVKPLPADDYNPATWMLEVIGAGVGVGSDSESAADSAQTTDFAAVFQSTDFAAVFQSSAKKAELEAALANGGVTRPLDGVDALTFASKRAASESTQATLLIQRFFRTYWRTPDYMLTRALVYFVLALVFGLSYAGRDWDSYKGINAGIGMGFITSVFVGVIAFEAASPMAMELRASFYRERASQTYNAFWYFVGSSLVEIPYVFVTCLVFAGVFFPLAGFTGVGTFLLYWFHLSMYTLLQTYMGEFLALVFPDLGLTMTIGVVINTVGFNTAGFNPPAAAMPAAYEWLNRIAPPQFIFSITGALLFGQCDDASGGELGCRELQGDLPPQFEPGTTIQQYISRVFLIDSDDVWPKFGVVVCYIVLFRVLTLLTLRFVSHQRT